MDRPTPVKRSRALRSTPAPATDPLRAYQGKRNFALTPEPAGVVDPALAGRFVVQKHWASRLHYDFRLELDGVLKSWALPKGPSLDPTVKRMAVEVEDHPVAYATFEGSIPAGEYGAGRVIVWDTGDWQALGDAREGLRAGHLKIELRGQKLHGRWALVRLKNQDSRQPAWLLIKERDAHAVAEADHNIVEALPDSVKAPGAADKPRRPASSAPARASDPAPAWPAGAVPCALPARFSPQLATRVEQPPADGADWLYEIKFDGYRLLARIERGQVALFTRNGHDWTGRLLALQRSLVSAGLPDGWYDGELVMPGADGQPDFGALQQAFDSERIDGVVWHVFDVPHVDGHDLTGVPLMERRAVLARLLTGVDSSMLRMSETFEGAGADVLQAACRLGLEGVIAKRRDSVYVSRRSGDWLKLKCGQRQEFVIGGYTVGQGARAGLGALMLGVHEAGGLRHVGNVGTGFSQTGLAELLRRLVPLARDQSPFLEGPRAGKTVRWTQPDLVAEVGFTGWTPEGRVRHGVFLGLRDDKPAAGVQREWPQPADPPAPGRHPSGPPVPAKAPTASSSARPTVRLTHPERVIDASTGSTKLDLFQHYEVVGALMIEHVRQRPLAMLRAPDGIQGQTFFQKHLSSPLPGITGLDASLSPGHAPLMTVATARGLLSAAQFNVVEFHTQNAVARRFDTPNRLVFDLDPGEGVAWAQVQEAAQLTQALLTQLGLPCLLKTSGGKGLHVVVPIRQQHGWDEAKAFSQAVVQHMAEVIPQRFVARSGPKNRVGKIFVDYLRNGLGATTVSAWSLRARAGLGVSVPVAWSELDGLRGGDHWNIHNIHERLSIGNAPWNEGARPARSLTSAIQQLGKKP